MRRNARPQCGNAPSLKRRRLEAGGSPAISLCGTLVAPEFAAGLSLSLKTILSRWSSGAITDKTKLKLDREVGGECFLEAFEFKVVD